MKRTGFLMERLCTRENALQAIFEINKERKRNKTAQWVERTKEERALELCKIVHDFRPKPPRTFTCYDPTLNPVLMGGMDYYCCGSIPGRGRTGRKELLRNGLIKTAKAQNTLSKWTSENIMILHPRAQYSYMLFTEKNQRIDNFVFLNPNKKKLHKAVREIMKFLNRLGLQLKGNWQIYNTRKRMVNAVGYRMKLCLTLIRKKNLLR